MRKSVEAASEKKAKQAAETGLFCKKKAKTPNGVDGSVWIELIVVETEN